MTSPIFSDHFGNQYSSLPVRTIPNNTGHFRNLSSCATTYASATNSATWTSGIGSLTVTAIVKESHHFSFWNTAVATAGTQIATGAGILHTVSVNTKSAGGTLSLYDAVSATNPIAVLDTTIGQDTLIFDVKFSTGLYAVVADGGVTHANLTISYDLLTNKPCALVVFDAPNDAVASSWLTDAGSSTTDVQYYPVFPGTDPNNEFIFYKSDGSLATITRCDVLPLVDGMRMILAGV